MNTEERTQLCTVMADRPRSAQLSRASVSLGSDTCQTGDRQEDDAPMAVLLDHVCEHRMRAEFQHHSHNHLT